MSPEKKDQIIIIALRILVGVAILLQAVIYSIFIIVLSVYLGYGILLLLPFLLLAFISPACAVLLDEIIKSYDYLHASGRQDLVYRLRKRAEIRRRIDTRKSVKEGKPDRICDLLEEAADTVEYLEGCLFG